MLHRSDAQEISGTRSLLGGRLKSYVGKRRLAGRLTGVLLHLFRGADRILCPNSSSDGLNPRTTSFRWDAVDITRSQIEIGIRQASGDQSNSSPGGGARRMAEMELLPGPGLLVSDLCHWTAPREFLIVPVVVFAQDSNFPVGRIALRRAAAAQLRRLRAGKPLLRLDSAAPSRHPSRKRHRFACCSHEFACLRSRSR
jgi:hypothetical protein